jgi:hypothetical protein
VGIKLKKSIVFASTALVLSASLCANSFAQTTQQQENEYAPKALPLVAVVAFLKPLLEPVVKDFFTNLFRSWMQPLSDNLNYVKKEDVKGQDQNPKPSQVSAELQKQPQADKVFAENTKTDANSKVALPTLIARIVKVDAQGKILASISPEQNTMKTGERFILEYTANMPGLIMSQNRDGSMKIDELDFAQVGPAVVNKLPIADESYTLNGDPGTETFRVLFLPCRDINSGDGGVKLSDLNGLLTSATSAGGEFAAKGVIKIANEKTTASAGAILTPTAMKSLTGCNKAQLDMAAKQGFGSLVSKSGVQGQATIAQGKQEGQVVELLVMIDHQKPVAAGVAGAVAATATTGP